MSRKRFSLANPGPMLPPVPAILLSINGRQGDPEELSVGWTFIVNGNPPQIGISFEYKHVAHDLVSLHGEFVLNLPTIDIVEAFDIVDMNSYKKVDKYALSGLTKGQAMIVNAPTIEESPLHLECKLIKSVDLPPNRSVFIAQVLATNVIPGVCDEQGRLQVASVPFFGMTAGSGEFYMMGHKVGHIGQSVGRNDIKY